MGGQVRLNGFRWSQLPGLGENKALVLLGPQLDPGGKGLSDGNGSK